MPDLARSAAYLRRVNELHILSLDPDITTKEFLDLLAELYREFPEFYEGKENTK